MLSYGFVKVHRDPKKEMRTLRTPTPQRVQLPQGAVEQKMLAYARAELPDKVLNHSLRVYCYAVAIMRDQFPEWDLDLGVLFSTSLLHDIGTTAKNMHATKMLFEFYGGWVAHAKVMEETADRDYADAVAEAVIRHQDLGDSGFITSLGLILQIATIMDNVGKHMEMIHPETVHHANAAYPRDGWLGCFAAAIDRENEMKPWGHTSALGVPDFRDAVLGNKTVYSKM